MYSQRIITLNAKPRGFHLITDTVTGQLPSLQLIDIGLLHLFLQHTSASLTINENADISVRQDFESYFNHSVPENAPYYTHTMEGPDDMPAHLKASILGHSVSIPVAQGKLCLGTWQGIYLGEHRDRADKRRLVATLQGSERDANA